ncbi:hypothetical protein JYT75_01165 [Oceanicaulis sp. AH-315-P02]|nr:hypothetical protein [Robiginitomaculum sp.]MBN4047908.1 hypothetical protein [Oceanicaulis sp. AH-315-P02]
MKKQNFFKLIWQFNALGIALGIAFGIGLTILLSLYVLYQIVTNVSSQRQVNNIINVKAEQQQNQMLRIGGPNKVKGYDIISFKLYADSKSKQYNFSKSSPSNIVNYIFFDYESQDTNWLLDHSNFLITSTLTVAYKNSSNNGKVITQAFIYSLVKKDTNNDGKRTRTDDKSISIASYDGKKYTELFSNVRRLIGIEQMNSQEVIIVFEDADGTYIATISLENFMVKYKKSIPKLPQKALE